METIIQNKEKAALEAFESLPEGTPAQLIGGEIIMSPAPNAKHQIVLTNLIVMLYSFVHKKNHGTVITSPIDVHFSDEEVYQPDIIFISKSNESIIRENIDGAPDLVVEILSPSNAYHDLRHKWRIYERYGVKEYWIVDPMAKSIEILKNRAGEFQRISRAFETGSVQSNLLKGLAVDLGDVFGK